MQNPLPPFGSLEAHPERLLLAASTGGHLTQLNRLATAAGLAADATWVTFDSPQSRSMLAGRRVVWVDYIAPRDIAGTARAYRALTAALDPSEYDAVVSTGAALAVAAFAWAKQHRLRSRYIESVSRTNGPSLTGKIVRSLRLAETYTQHSAWASPSWRLTTSVLGSFARETKAVQVRHDRPLTLVVSLGTIQPYRFDRLIDQVLQATRPDDTILWQLGSGWREGLPGETHTLLGPEELLSAAKQADAVITHAGVGTILQFLGAGLSPIVVPRSRAHGEHIDDHQHQIWQLLRDSDVAVPVTVDQLTRQHLLHAANSRTVVREAAA